MFLKHFIENLTEWIIDQIASNTKCDFCSKKLFARVKVRLNTDESFIRVYVDPCDCQCKK